MVIFKITRTRKKNIIVVQGSKERRVKGAGTKMNISKVIGTKINQKLKV